MCSYIMFDKSETVKKLITNSEKCRISQLKNSYSKNVCLISMTMYVKSCPKTSATKKNCFFVTAFLEIWRE